MYFWWYHCSIWSLWWYYCCTRQYLLSMYRITGNSKNKQSHSKKKSYFVNSYFSISFHTGFASGVVTSDPVDGKCWRTWAWLTLIIPLSNTILAAASVIIIIIANNTIPAELITLFIFLCS